MRLLLLCLLAAAVVVACAFWVERSIDPEPYFSRAQAWRGDEQLIRLHRFGNILLGIETVALPLILLVVGMRLKAWRISKAFPALVAEFALFMLLLGGSFILRWVGVFVATPKIVGLATAACAVFGAVLIGHLIYSVPALCEWLLALRRAQDVGAGRSARKTR